jgi:hypothetical protein
VTSPQGATTNVTITADAAALFTGPLFMHVGGQPNDTSIIGRSTVLGRITIANAPETLDSVFPGSGLDTGIWGYAAADVNGIVVVPSDSKYWFKWTVPASADAYVMAKPTITGPWTDLGLTNVVLAGARRQVLVPASSLPSANSGFFALGKRQYTKLQILLPGETAAPGTPTGKTGTPDPQFVGNPFNVTVNAVTDNWIRVTGATNVVSLSTTDTTALVPANTALTGGTATLSVTLNSLGNWTITASDVTEPSKPSNTSPPVNVQ